MKDDLLEYWTGYYTVYKIGAGSIRWRNYRRVSLPAAFSKANPRSFVICIYPTNSTSYSGTPTISVTVIDTAKQTDFETVVAEAIPLKKANFKVPVEIQFSFVKGKYVYGSEFVFLFCFSF